MAARWSRFGAGSGFDALHLAISMSLKHLMGKDIRQLEIIAMDGADLVVYNLGIIHWKDVGFVFALIIPDLSA